MRLVKPLCSFVLTLLAIASAGADDNDKKSPGVDLYGDPLPEGALMRLGTVRFRHDDPVTCVAWSPDGKTLASASEDKMVRLWDPATGKEMRSCSGHDKGVRCVAWSPDGKTLASASWDNTVRLWDPATGKEIHSCSGHEGPVFCVAWSPDGKALASASRDATVRLWDPASGKEIRSCSGHQDCVWCVSWSPDGKTMASASDDKTVRLWDPATGKQIRSCLGHQGDVLCLTWSPDGKTLASVSGDQTLRLWDSATGKQIRSCSGHHDRVMCVAWSPSGRVLATTAGWDEMVSLWDPATGKQIRWVAVPSRIESLAFSPDGERLATANSDSTVLIWDVPSVPLEKRKLADAELSRLWADLGSDDAAKADRALWTLVAVPERSVPLLKEQLPPAKPDPKLAEKLSKLIANLDSEEFAVRDKAATELAKLGVQAEPALKKALTAKPSVEVRSRIESLLEPFSNNWPGMPLETWRALAVLERIGSDDARQLLKGLSEGDPDSRLTREASAALERLRTLQANKPK